MKPTGSSTTATKKARPRAKKKPAARKKASGAKKAAGKSKAASRSRAVRPRTQTLGDRLTDVVEQMAAGALRRVADVGGREIAGWLPEAKEVRREAGDYLRELRELAGLTTEELADAVELNDSRLLAAVEAGRSTLSFELILRLAAILARHDPVPFISRMVRSYNPVLWQLLEDWGIGRLPLQLVREREFVNVLRGNDAARDLSDEDFARVLDFTRSAFETALHFAEPHPDAGSAAGGNTDEIDDGSG